MPPGYFVAVTVGSIGVIVGITGLVGLAGTLGLMLVVGITVGFTVVTGIVVVGDTLLLFRVQPTKIAATIRTTSTTIISFFMHASLLLFYFLHISTKIFCMNIPLQLKVKFYIYL